MVLTITKKMSNRKTRSVMLLRLKPASILLLERRFTGVAGHFAGDSKRSMNSMVRDSIFCTTLFTRATNRLYPM